MGLDFSMKILVAEDSGFMQKLFIKNLNDIGFKNITVAPNGAEAMTQLKAEHFDIIISDWNMPIKDGLDFLKEVRSLNEYHNTPFIMATAQGDMSKVEEAKAAGSNGHIAKPFTSALLKEAIEESMGMKKAAAPQERGPRMSGNKVKLRIGHIQITDHLVLGIVKHKIATGELTPKYFELETERMPGWNPIQKELSDGTLDGSFVLAPIAMDLFAYNVPIKLISLAHKNGSIFVRSKLKPGADSSDLKSLYMNKVINIPHKMSVHNMLAHKFLTDLGLKPGVPGKEEINVTFEVVPPIQMPRSLMLHSNVAGFIVAEPIGSNAISKGIAELQFLSKSLWEDHPCCVVAMRDEVARKFPDAVNEFTQMLVEAGKFAQENKAQAAEIAYGFLDPDKKLGLSVPVLQKVLEAPNGITMGDLYPVLEDLDKMQRYMYNKMGIGKLIDVEKFVDFTFIKEAVK